MKENDFVEMDRHVKHGENTFPNWMAMFAGKIGFESKVRVTVTRVMYDKRQEKIMARAYLLCFYNNTG